MRISKLIADYSFAQLEGLRPFDVRMGATVALFGKNGAGKTRFLNLVEHFVVNLVALDDFIYERVQFPPKLVTPILMNYEAVDFYKLSNQLDAGLDTANPTEYAELRRRYNNIRATKPDVRAGFNTLKTDTTLSEIRERYIRRIRVDEIKALQSTFNESSLKSTSFEQLLAKIDDSAIYNELSSISASSLEYLSKLPHELLLEHYEAAGNQSEFEKSLAFQRYTSLRRFIGIFLQKDLTWKKAGGTRNVSIQGADANFKAQWLLNGHPFNYQAFSDGEKVLFAYSLLFFLLDQNPGVEISECIILIDEPELHLHPKMEIELIQRLKEVVREKGQLIIATHSINILSSLSHDEIYLVRNSEIFSPQQSTPSNSLIELLGLEGDIDKLQTFFTSISNWVYLNFMQQCFLEPEVISPAKGNDPELEVLKQAVCQEHPTVLLDFGAGKGRIFKEMRSEDLLEKISYSALDVRDDNIESLKSIGIERVFKSYKDLNEEMFDFVLLCNVLHELPVDEWASILNALRRSLKPEGYLVLIEDTKMPKGEDAGTNGFLTMDKQSLQILFSLEREPFEFKSNQSQFTDRILCVAIKKEQAEDITEESLQKSLVKLSTNTKQRLRKLRLDKEEPIVRKAREAAFLSQLYINCILTLEDITEKKGQINI